ALWGHGFVVVGRDDGAGVKRALGSFAGNDGCAGVTALDRVCVSIEAQTAFWFLAAVTAQALDLENRFYILAEIDISGPRGRYRGQRPRKNGKTTFHPIIGLLFPRENLKSIAGRMTKCKIPGNGQTPGTQARNGTIAIGRVWALGINWYLVFDIWSFI